MNITARLEKLEKSIKSKLDEYCKLPPPLVIIIHKDENRDERINEEKEKRCKEISSELKISLEQAKTILEGKAPIIIIDFTRKKDREKLAD